MNVRPKTRAHTYRAQLEWTGASAGPTQTYAGYSREYRIDYEGKAAVTGSADPAFRGDAALLNPEDLLVGALSSCHLLSYLAVCALAHVAVASYSDEATGTMEETGGAGRFVRVVLRPRVTIAGGDLEKAKALHEEAHRQCFVSASVNFPVEVEAEVRHA